MHQAPHVDLEISMLLTSRASFRIVHQAWGSTCSYQGHEDTEENHHGRGSVGNQQQRHEKDAHEGHSKIPIQLDLNDLVRFPVQVRSRPSYDHSVAWNTNRESVSTRDSSSYPRR